MTRDGSAPEEVEGGLDEPEGLEPEQGSLALASPEDQHTVADWEAAAAGVLRKAGRMKDQGPDAQVWAAMAHTTLDEIEITPLGTGDVVEERTILNRPTRAGAWDIRSPLGGSDAKAVNEAALVDLENGATSLLLHVGETDGDWPDLLDGVLLDLAPVALDRPSPEQAETFAAFLEEHDGPLAPQTNLSFDPETFEMLPHRTPEAGFDVDETAVALARRAVQLGVRALVVDGTALHDRGGSDAQELGWSMAVGVRYLRVLEGAGFSVDEAAPLIEFRYAATDEQFPTIAKLRAARRLWARVLEASGGADVPQAQHAITSRPMMGAFDPWVNMLRGTIAAFAAGVGGADAVTVVPFDERLGHPDAFGRRIARNTSSLLVSESHVARVVDPAGGSYAVEKLTADLAVAGWAELGRIEADGGARSEAARDDMVARVREVRGRRDEQVADRSRPLTGISEFPHLGETLPERPPAPGRGVRHYGWAYEDMRTEPSATPVFLATMGAISAYTARATFATNLFAAGGVAVDVAGPTESSDDVVAAYDGQPVVCLAGTDAAYAEWGADAAGALRQAGATHVVIAGKSTDYADDSCAVGIDALDFLARTREKLT